MTDEPKPQDVQGVVEKLLNPRLRTGQPSDKMVPSALDREAATALIAAQKAVDGERELVAFFNSPAGLAMGLKGDYEHWKPAQTATHFLTAYFSEHEGRVRAEKVLRDLLPGPLCGESWKLPDTETVEIKTTFGRLKAARAHLSGKGS